MPLKVMLLDAPSNLVFTQALTATLSDVDLFCFEEVEACLRDLRADAENNSWPDAVLLGPGLDDPISIARKVHWLAPESNLVFATKTDPIIFKQDMSKAPMIGQHWSIVDSNQPDLAVVVCREASSSRRRRSWRQTIDNVNAKLTHAAEGSQQRHQAYLSERKLTHILRYANEAIVIMGADGCIQAWNHGAEKLFKRTARQALGAQLVDIADSAWAQKTRALIDRLNEDCLVVSDEITCQLLQSDKESHLLLSLSIVTDDDDRHIALCANIRDISDHKRQEYAIRQYSRKLEASNKELQQYMYALTHDLKSPLVTISGYVSRIAKQYSAGDTEQLERNVGRIERAVSQMSELIDDLMSFYRIGNVVAKRRPLSLHQALTQIVSDLEEVIAKTHSKVVLTDLPTVEIAESEVRQLFENLIGNALKYACDKPNTTIIIGCVEQIDEYWVFVKDQGPGIEERYQQQIFELFQRLSEDTRGSGVGLAIVAKLMTRLGGRVWVESQEGEGACFWLAFPKFPAPIVE